MTTVQAPPFVPATVPTPAERIRLLQQAADEEANHLFDDFCLKIEELDRMAKELTGLGNSFMALSHAARELAPQIERWAQIAHTARLKRRG